MMSDENRAVWLRDAVKWHALYLKHGREWHDAACWRCIFRWATGILRLGD